MVSIYSFKGLPNSSVTPPEDKEQATIASSLTEFKNINEAQFPTDVMSKEAASATRAAALARIFMSNNMKFHTLPDEYIEQLKKQGKTLDKDFSVSTIRGMMTMITEKNESGETVRTVTFAAGSKDYPHKTVTYALYNPKTKLLIKTVSYQDNGQVAIGVQGDNSSQVINKGSS